MASFSCAQCNNNQSKLLLCGACKQVRYCSKNCQVSHWKSNHKHQCKQMRNKQNKASETKNEQNVDKNKNVQSSAKKNSRKIDLSKLNGACFTDKTEIEKLIIENQKYQSLATQKHGGTVICEIGKDCIKISGDCGSFKPIREYLIDDELNLKQIITNYPDCIWINNMCGPQIILKEVVKGCKFLKVRLDIKIFSIDKF